MTSAVLRAPRTLRAVVQPCELLPGSGGRDGGEGAARVGAEVQGSRNCRRRVAARRARSRRRSGRRPAALCRPAGRLRRHPRARDHAAAGGSLGPARPAALEAAVGGGGASSAAGMKGIPSSAAASTDEWAPGPRFYNITKLRVNRERPPRRFFRGGEERRRVRFGVGGRGGFNVFVGDKSAEARRGRSAARSPPRRPREVSSLTTRGDGRRRASASSSSMVAAHAPEGEHRRLLPRRAAT